MYHNHTRSINPGVYTHLPRAMFEHLVMWMWISIGMCIDRWVPSIYKTSECGCIWFKPPVWLQNACLFAKRLFVYKTPVWLQNACLVAKRMFGCKTPVWLQNACLDAKRLFGCKMHTWLQDVHETPSRSYRPTIAPKKESRGRFD